MSIATNRFVNRIMKQVCESDPCAAVEQLVGKRREPGETLERLAEKLGVRQINTARMRFDGGIFEDNSGLAIKLNSDAPIRRRRFTLAHELAHLILSSGSAVGARRTHGSTQLEQACDFVAAELLMPWREFRSFAPRTRSTETLLAIASHFEVSVHAAAVRLHQLGLWTDSVGQWSWKGRAQELWFVGRRFWASKTVSPRTFQLAVTRCGEASGWEWIEGHGERDGFPAHFDVRKLGRDNIYLLAVIRKASATDLSRLRSCDFSTAASITQLQISNGARTVKWQES